MKVHLCTSLASLARTIYSSVLLQAPLTSSVREQVDIRVLSQMKCLNQSVKSMVDFAVSIENGTYDAWKLPTVLVFMLVTFMLSGGASLVCIGKYQQNKAALHNTFILSIPELQSTKSLVSMNSAFTGRSAASCGWNPQNLDPVLVKQDGGETLLLAPLCTHLDPGALRWSCKLATVKLRDLAQHVNVMKFLGLSFYRDKWYLVSTYPIKGKLTITVARIHTFSRIVFSYAFIRSLK